MPTRGRVNIGPRSQLNVRRATSRANGIDDQQAKDKDSRIDISELSWRVTKIKLIGLEYNQYMPIKHNSDTMNMSVLKTIKFVDPCQDTAIDYYHASVLETKSKWKYIFAVGTSITLFTHLCHFTKSNVFSRTLSEDVDPSKFSSGRVVLNTSTHLTTRMM